MDHMELSVVSNCFSSPRHCDPVLRVQKSQACAGIHTGSFYAANVMSLTGLLEEHLSLHGLLSLSRPSQHLIAPLLAIFASKP